MLHLHGYYEEPESVVLGVGDYEKVKNDLYGEMLLRLFTLDRTMIFVGCRDTVEDPNFSHLITWACEALKDVGHRHFILCRESEVEAIRAKLQQKNAHWLYPVAYGKDYSDLAPYLRKLAPSNVVKPSAQASLDYALTDYARALRTKYARVKLETVENTGSSYRELMLEQIFVPQNVRLCQEYRPQVLELPKELLAKLRQKGEIDQEDLDSEELEKVRRLYFEQPQRNVLEALEEREQQRVVILGDPGAGKSSLLQHRALQWCALSAVEQSRTSIPLLIELRAYALARQQNQCRDFEAFIAEGMGMPCRFSRDALVAGLKESRFCVCFDALDEVFDPHWRETVVNEILRFAHEYPQVRLVLTSRIFGYQGAGFRDAGFQHWMLQDLEDEQIADFLQRWHTTTFAASEEEQKKLKQEQIRQAIEQSPSIRQLAGNPLLLTMMAVLNRYRELPRDRVELYQECSKLLLQQWKVDEALRADDKLKQDAGAIGLAEKEAILMSLARTMQQGHKTEDTTSTPTTAAPLVNLISTQRLEQVIQNELKSIVIANPLSVARAVIKHFRTRNFILCFLGGENYSFIHRTFLEYYCARDLQRQFQEEQSLSLDGLQELIGRYYQEDTWQEVLRLVAGMLAPRFVKEFIEFLLQQKDPEQNCQHLFLAASFVGEVRKRKELGNTEQKVHQQLHTLLHFDLSYDYNFWEPESGRVRLIRQKAVQELARVWKSDSGMQPWLKSLAQNDEDGKVREAAVLELARGWGADPGTQSWLKSLAQNDEHWSVREAAVHELARGWRDAPGTLSWLKSLAQNDQHEDVREAAVRGLARGWRDDSETLIILKDRAQNDPHKDVRSAAVHELARGWGADPETLIILKALAQNDQHEDVREAAVHELARGWGADPETLVILKDRAQNDQHEDVREAAVRGLARGWRDDSETLIILKDRAQNDQDEDVRQAAVRELACGWGHDPDVQAWLAEYKKNKG